MNAKGGSKMAGRLSGRTYQGDAGGGRLSRGVSQPAHQQNIGAADRVAGGGNCEAELTVAAIATVEHDESVPQHKRCPLCWGGRGGVGLHQGNYNAKSRVYLKCGQCGFDWTADVKVTIEVLAIHHGEISDLQTRDGIA